MSDDYKAPHNLAEFVDPLKEWFTWKWVTVAFLTVCALFSEFVLFCISFVAGEFLITLLIILGAVATLVLFFIYAMTPKKLEENINRILFNKRIKHGIDTFAKHSPFVKKWVISNFSGLIEIDEETGLCKEKTNSELTEWVF